MKTESADSRLALISALFRAPARALELKPCHTPSESCSEVSIYKDFEILCRFLALLCPVVAAQRFIMTSFQGQVIALTGAASGIALATARLLASRGASISLADVRQEPLDAAVADIKKSNPDVKIYAKAVNVKYSQEVGDWLDETVKHLGPCTLCFLLQPFWYPDLILSPETCLGSNCSRVSEELTCLPQERNY